MRLAAAAVAAVLASVLTGCSFSVGGPSAVPQEELEKQVAGLYEAEDDIAAECEGELPAEADATTDCHLTVGEAAADVHVTVTSVDGDDVEFTSAPYVPADTVADTIKASLADQGYQVDTVECEDELAGKLDATTTCTAQPAEGDGVIEVTVTQADGLMINFDYEVVS